jgi:ABC-2 type transport system permease protein
MNAYYSIMAARFRALLQYRAAAAAGLGTQVFWGLMKVMVFQAFYASSSAHQPMSLAQSITYIWLGQAMLAMLPWNVDREIAAMIRSGNVVYELLRPRDLYAIWFARILALRTAPTLLRAVPMFIIAMLFFGMQAPPSIGSALAYAVSMLAAILLSAAITEAISISLLWTISGDGIARIVPGLVTILSGMIVPLPLFPAWAQSALNWSPFRGIADIPYRLYMGHIPPDQLPLMLANQLGWTVVLVLIGRWILARGTRRLVVQGG